MTSSQSSWTAFFSQTATLPTELHQKSSDIDALEIAKAKASGLKVDKTSSTFNPYIQRHHDIFQTGLRTREYMLLREQTWFNTMNKLPTQYALTLALLSGFRSQLYHQYVNVEQDIATNTMQGLGPSIADLASTCGTLPM